MGTNSKARREAKKKRQRHRAAAEPIFDVDEQGALRIWYALGAGEYADDPQEQELFALIVTGFLGRAGHLDAGPDAGGDPGPADTVPYRGMTARGLRGLANSLPPDVRAGMVQDLADWAGELISDGRLTRSADGTVTLEGAPGDPAVPSR